MDLITLIATCAPMVAPTTMKAIVLEESRGHPYAIHDGKHRRALFPEAAPLVSKNVVGVHPTKRFTASACDLLAPCGHPAVAPWASCALAPPPAVAQGGAPPPVPGGNIHPGPCAPVAAAGH